MSVTRKLYATLKGCGYQCTTRTIDSRQCGLPQHRVRWYLVALLAHGRVGSRDHAVDMDEVWARADAKGACGAALGDFPDPDLPWRKVGEVSRGRRFNRNLEHLKNVAAKLHSSEASKHFIVADMGASAQRRQASVDECPCITCARGTGKRL